MQKLIGRRSRADTWVLGTILAACLVAGSARAEVPRPLVPGDLDGPAPIAEACPEFRWTGSPEVSHEIRVLELGRPNEGRAARDEDAAKMEDSVRISHVAPPGQSEWTPVGDCLEPDVTYAWFVREIGGADAGPWSAARFFRLLAESHPSLVGLGENRPTSMEVVHEPGAESAGLSAPSEFVVEAYRVLTAGPAPLVLPPSAFQPATELTIYGHYDAFDPDCSGDCQQFLYGNSDPWWDCFYAPVYVPFDSTIERMYATVYDDHATLGIGIELWEASVYDGSASPITFMGSWDLEANETIRVIASPTINHTVIGGKYLQLKLCLWEHSHRFYSLRIYLKGPGV